MARMHQRNWWISFLISMAMLIPVMLYAASDVGGDGLFNFTPNTVISSSEVNKNFDVLGNFMTTYEDAITVDGNGNVGVGTTSPAETLTVEGGATVRTGGAGNVLTFSADPVNGPSILGHTDSSGNSTNGAYTGTRIRVANAGFYVDTAPVNTTGTSRTWTNRMIIKDGGNVGIGTTTPATLLHIQSSSPEVVIAGEGSASLRLCSKASTLCDQGSRLYQSLNSFSIIGDGDPNTLINFLTRGSTGGAVERMRIDSNGNVGIGTTSPTFMLDVNGNVNAADGLHIDDGSALRSGNTNAHLVGRDSDGRISLGSGNPGDYLVLNANGLETMRLASNGLVGIGTTNPTYRLDVNGTLRAYGITDASSRQYKDHIRTLEADDALKALTALRPTRYHYKQDNTEERLGFIAEEVPELLAMKDRQGVSSMDVVAVLTRVVQVQQTQLEEQRKQLETLRKQVEGIAATATK